MAVVAYYILRMKEKKETFPVDGLCCCFRFTFSHNDYIVVSENDYETKFFSSFLWSKCNIILKQCETFGWNWQSGKKLFSIKHFLLIKTNKIIFYSLASVTMEI